MEEERERPPEEKFPAKVAKEASKVLQFSEACVICITLSCIVGTSWGLILGKTGKRPGSLIG